MKRLISILLVAVLIVAGLSTIAFAAGTATVSGNTKTAEAGDEVTLTFTVEGEFANYELVLSTSSPLEIVKISGITANQNTGKVAWANDENVEKHSFNVTVKVAEDAKPGTYNVNAEVLFVSDRNLELQTTSVNPGKVIIEEPVCEHNWVVTEEKAPTCTEEGYQIFTCSKCGATKKDILQVVEHTIGTKWIYDNENYKKGHWHVCTVCGAEFDHAEHGDWQYDVLKEPTTEEDGLKKITCGVCGWYYTEKIDKNKDPGGPATGDITPVIALGVTAVITLAGTSLYVFKRK